MSEHMLSFRELKKSGDDFDVESFSVLATDVYFKTGEYFERSRSTTTLVLVMNHVLDAQFFLKWLSTRGVRVMNLYHDHSDYKFVAMPGSIVVDAYNTGPWEIHMNVCILSRTPDDTYRKVSDVR